METNKIENTESFIPDYHLSKGCQLCQQGKWFCIYVTYRCNAHCHFCPAPFQNDQINTAFGNKKEEILPFLKKYKFEGISFSGGDPFLVFDRLMEWIIFFKKNLPDLYYWVYTNGLAADKSKLQQLSVVGIDEIRFNIAATEYNSELIWDRIKAARDFFPFVSVEIPSISKDYRLLESSLEKLHEIGVNYLNLHDYILSESDNSFTKEPYGTFVLNKTMRLKYAISSIKNTQDIINLSSERKYNFHINHCSMQQKELQMTQRRLKMCEIFNDQEYDLVIDDGTICNFYSIPNNHYSEELPKKFLNLEFRTKLTPFLVKIDELENVQQSGNKTIRTTYIPQMEINQEKILIGLTLLD